MDRNAYPGARRDILHPRPGFERKIVKGHDAVLKALQDSGREVTIFTLKGQKFVGKIVGRDKFTITLLTARNIGEITDETRGTSVRRVFYKHALEHFFGDEAG